MIAWIKRILRAWVVEPEAPNLVQMESVSVGETASQKLSFWLELRSWLQMPQGHAYMAIQQKEYERLHVGLLHTEDKSAMAEIVAQMRQQNFVISLPQEIDKKIAKWNERASREKKVPE